jgi:hypothetical protein
MQRATIKAGLSNDPRQTALRSARTQTGMRRASTNILGPNACYEM